MGASYIRMSLGWVRLGQGSAWTWSVCTRVGLSLSSSFRGLSLICSKINLAEAHSLGIFVIIKAMTGRKVLTIATLTLWVKVMLPIKKGILCVTYYDWLEFWELGYIGHLGVGSFVPLAKPKTKFSRRFYKRSLLQAQFPRQAQATPNPG